VRVLIPGFGERVCMQIGLLAFAVQCGVITFARSPGALAGSILLSLLTNLVYPAASSLVSRVVATAGQGEAMGALNGLRALTEG
jgi:hypothetical protein